MSFWAKELVVANDGIGHCSVVNLGAERAEPLT